MIQTYSFNLSTESGSKAAITAASKPFGGRCPDAIFLCAGAYMPVYTPGMSDDDLVAAADYAYWVQAWSATVSIDCGGIHIRIQTMLRMRTLINVFFNSFHLFGPYRLADGKW